MLARVGPTWSELVSRMTFTSSAIPLSLMPVWVQVSTNSSADSSLPVRVAMPSAASLMVSRVSCALLMVSVATSIAWAGSGRKRPAIRGASKGLEPVGIND